MPSPAHDNSDYPMHRRLQNIENALLMLIDIQLGGERDDDVRFVLEEAKRAFIFSK